MPDTVNFSTAGQLSHHWHRSVPGQCSIWQYGPRYVPASTHTHAQRHTHTHTDRYGSASLRLFMSMLFIVCRTTCYYQYNASSFVFSDINSSSFTAHTFNHYIYIRTTILFSVETKTNGAPSRPPPCLGTVYADPAWQLVLSITFSSGPNYTTAPLLTK